MHVRMEKAAAAAITAALLLLVGFALRTPAASQPHPARPNFSPSGAAGSTPPPAPPSPIASPSPTTSATAGPKPAAKAQRIAFLGDSFAEGKGISAPTRKWTAIVSTQRKAEEINLAHAGTGYTRAGKARSCETTACPDFGASAEAAVTTGAQTIIITGGANDNSSTPAQVAAALTRIVATLKKGLPMAKIYVVNPWWDLRPVGAADTAIASAIKSAANKAGATYLDTGQPVAGVPALMLADGSGPNDQGHAAIATSVQRALKKYG